jgi:dTDP-4-dehydrorhamnose 3,5-epimerase
MDEFIGVRPLPIEGAWEFLPRVFADERGSFAETYAWDILAEATGYRLEVAQMNTSTSAAGVVRGIHYADVPPGQAKYVSCASGSALDVIVDIRVGSPTFGRWVGVPIDDVRRNAVFIVEGLGHAFCAHADDTVITYAVSSRYDPVREHEINPFDAAIGIDWGWTGDIRLSEKDRGAPTLAEAMSLGLLPKFNQTS